MLPLRPIRRAALPLALATLAAVGACRSAGPAAAAAPPPARPPAPASAPMSAPASPIGGAAAMLGGLGLATGEPSPRPYALVITPDMRSRRGLFTTHRTRNRLLYEIQPGELGKDML